MSLLLDTTIKVSLIVLIALVATVLFRNRSAALRHWMLSVAIACAATVPMLQPIAPSWNVQLNVPFALQRQAQPQVGAGYAIGDEGAAAPAREGELPGDPPSAGWLASLAWDPALAGVGWALGAAFSLLVLAVGMGRLAWLASRSERVDDGRWAELAADISRAFGLKRPVEILQSDHPTLLVTWGVRRPKVILPASAREWSDARMRVVLLHELAHVRRGDWVTQMAAEGLRAAYWFNPLVWMASRRLRQESEQACDDDVLNGGVEGPEYATHLLALARSVRQNRRSPFAGFPAPAMARPSSLERRFRAMLNGHLNRKPITRQTRVGTMIAAATLTALIAGVGMAQTFSTFSGTALDPTNRFLPGVTLVLTNAQSRAKHEVQTDHLGRFEFVGLPPGDYVWEAQLMGFAALKGSVTVVGRDVQQDIGLQVGSLEETITVAGGARSATATSTPSRPRPDVEEIRRQDRLRVCSGNSERAGTGAEMGGNLKAPRKLVNVSPRYAEHLSAAKVNGVVVLNAIIDREGDVRDASVVSSPHPELDAAAVEAVRQWQFTSTILNCTPVEVKMKVTVNFLIQQ